MRLLSKGCVSLSILLAAVVAPAQPPEPKIGVVLLLEDQAGLNWFYRQMQISGLQKEDRVALITFARNTKVRTGFTNDRRELERAVHRLGLGRKFGIGLFADRNPSVPSVRIYRAVEHASGLFAKLPADHDTKRVVIVVFGDDDFSSKPGVPEMRSALDRARANLFAVAAHVESFRVPRPSTPPTFPGPQPGRIELLPPPANATRILTEVAQATGGGVAEEHWDLPEILARVRNRQAHPSTSPQISSQSALPIPAALQR